MRFDDFGLGELREVELLQPVQNLQAGERVLRGWWGDKVNLYSARLRQETGCGVIREVEVGEMGTDFVFTKRKLEPGEWPHYLMPCYVPGVFYHGHHIYFDGWWLRTNGNHKEDIVKRYIVSLFGKSLADFPYWQAFCEFFAERYPEGCYLEDLENAAAKGERENLS